MSLLLDRYLEMVDVAPTTPMRYEGSIRNQDELLVSVDREVVPEHVAKLGEVEVVAKLSRVE